MARFGWENHGRKSFILFTFYIGIFMYFSNLTNLNTDWFRIILILAICNVCLIINTYTFMKFIRLNTT